MHSNHYCPRCRQSDLPETAFDFTPVGRRQKHCRMCTRVTRSCRNYFSPKSALRYVRGIGLMEIHR